MTLAVVSLGPLALDGWVLLRSGLRWLREDGAACGKGDVLAFCNVGLRRTGAPSAAPAPFASEARDLQIAIVAPVAGRLRRVRGLELGGYNDFIIGLAWQPDEIIATLEHEEGEAPRALDAGLYLLAGERVTELAEVRSGLLTGWHGMSRAAHVAQEPPSGTLLSMGICEIEPVFKGRHHDFAELLREAPGPAQVVFVPDQVLVPSARVITEQIRRTPEAHARIAASIRGFIAGEEGTPDVAGWMFAAALVKALAASPATSRHDVLTRAGLHRSAAPDAILLSARAERAVTLRHRESGCTFNFHGYRLREAGAAFHRWLRANCDIVEKSAAGILDDYEEMIRTVREHNPAARVLISNITSSSGRDEVQCYLNMDAALDGVFAKDMNLVLAALAQRHDVAVIDVDAIAAELGIARHSANGLHHDGVMSDAIRAELVQVLAARRVPGFC